MLRRSSVEGSLLPLALASLLVAGCTVSGAEPASGGGFPGTSLGGAATTGSAGAGATAAAGTGQAAGGAGANDTPPPNTAATGTDPGRVTIRRLNRAEYDNTVRDLLGTAQTLGASTFPNDAPQIGFDNNGDLQTLSPVQFNLYVSAAQALVSEAFKAGSPQRAKLMTCDLASGAACAQTLITNLGLRAFRRPLSATEVSNYVALMATAAKAGATAEEQLQTVVQAILSSPNFLFRPEFDPDPASLTHMPWARTRWLLGCRT